MSNPVVLVFIDLNENRVRDELERIDKYFVPHRDKDGAGGGGSGVGGTDFVGRESRAFWSERLVALAEVLGEG